MFTVWLISRIKGHSFVLERAPLDVWIQELRHGLIDDQVVDIGLLKLNNWGRLLSCFSGLRFRDIFLGRFGLMLLFGGCTSLVLWCLLSFRWHRFLTRRDTTTLSRLFARLAFSRHYLCSSSFLRSLFLRITFSSYLICSSWSLLLLFCSFRHTWSTVLLMINYYSIGSQMFT